MEYFAATSDGFLLAANGIDPVLRWDGLTRQMEEAGLAPPATALTVTGNSLGTISGTYYAYSRFVDAYGNVSDLSPLAGPVIFEDILNVAYSDVPAPASAKVKRRQILRNTSGQTSVFYVDIDTEDLTSASFTSAKTDALLQSQEAVALFDEKGLPLANTNGVPPSDKSVVAAHLDRMFLAGEEVYSDGSVIVTFGSKTVTGIGTEWPASLAGRFLWVAGADKSYEIDSVDSVNQTLTLLEEYQSQTDPYAAYGIRPPVAQRRLVQFSRAGKPESWAAADALFVQEDNDDIVGLMPMGSFLYILERRHVYRLTFQQDPLDDGYVFLACNRGCVNGRCWAVVEDAAYMLDEAGVHMFTGSRQTEPVSQPIQDLFEPGNVRQRYRVRWEAAKRFHAVFDPAQQLVRWFVTLEGTGTPRHALCLDLRSKAWWVEEFPFPVGASCVGTLNGERRVFLGGPGGAVYLLGKGSLDVADPARGTVRGAVTARTPLSLTDDAASFGDDVAGAPVVLVNGEGRGQWRRVVEATATTLRLDRPWNTLPAAGDTYQVGGVRWRYRTGWFRWAVDEQENPRRLEILFEPSASEQTLDAYLYQDRSGEPVAWDSTYEPDELNGLGTVAGRQAMTGDLTTRSGWMQRRMDGHKEVYIDGPRLLSWGFEGVASEDGAIIYQITIDGAVGAQ
jgi:hypothetical protein